MKLLNALTLVTILSLIGCSSDQQTIDYALTSQSEAWFRHPVIGDVSFDPFTHEHPTVVHQGSEPYLWPVNCSLFKDPVSGHLYAYITMYPKGYWPPRNSGLRLHVIGYRSRDNGSSWDSLGIVLDDPDHLGGAADMHVTYNREDGRYYGCYGWVNENNTDGGLTMARATKPEGPFVSMGTPPIHREKEQPFIKGIYKRVYAGSIVKRKNDYLILAMMSTPHNAGSTWSVVAMTSRQIGEGYSAPQLLFSPQERRFFPALMENFSVYCDSTYLYYPFTSLAGNRQFQYLMRAPIERAHMADAYEIVEYGGGWHETGTDDEYHGIWGQQPSYCIHQDSLYALYPTLSKNNIGSIRLVKSPLTIRSDKEMRFTASQAPSLTFVKRAYTDLSLHTSFRVQGECMVFIAAPPRLTVQGRGAGASVNKESLHHYVGVCFNGREAVVVRCRNGVCDTIETVASTHEPHLVLTRRSDRVGVSINGNKSIATEIELPKEVVAGIRNEAQTFVSIPSFRIEGTPRPLVQQFDPSVALLDSGISELVEKLSSEQRSTDTTAFDSDSFLKFNFNGSHIAFFVDTLSIEKNPIDYYLDGVRRGSITSQKTELSTSSGYHSLTLEGKGIHSRIKHFEVSE